MKMREKFVSSAGCSFHRLVLWIVAFAAVAQLLDLIKFVLNHFGEDQFFPLIDGVLAFVDQMIVLAWAGLQRTTSIPSPGKKRTKG